MFGLLKPKRRTSSPLAKLAKAAVKGTKAGAKLAQPSAPKAQRRSAE